ncbi:MAG: hypothetical protein QNI92_03300 [Desulfobacterales bacterium]|nr:hypothetical protein [Desulfobacterales bacterium]
MAISSQAVVGDSPGLIGVRVLTAVSKLLYAPIISYSLYSRNWFPGNWIFIPLILNSLLWALMIYFLMGIWSKRTRV